MSKETEAGRLAWNLQQALDDTDSASWHDRVQEALSELVEYAEAQAARAVELEAALQPFAVAGRAQSDFDADCPDDGPIMTVYRDDECNSKAITLIRKHFREAARLVAP